jgi:hypothetical protein
LENLGFDNLRFGNPRLEDMGLDNLWFGEHGIGQPRVWKVWGWITWDLENLGIGAIGQ